MTRLTGANATENAGPAIRPAWLVSILGELYTTHDAPVTFSGNTYMPYAFSVGDIIESSGVSTNVQNLTFPSDVPFASSTTYYGSAVLLYSVLLDSTHTPIAGSITAWAGIVAAINKVKDADKSQIAVQCQDYISLLRRAGGLRFNSYDQKSRPGCSTDAFFDLMAKQKGRKLVWMGKSVNASTSGYGYSGAPPPWTRFSNPAGGGP